MQSRKLECLALSPMFDTILISDAEGISKPDPQIFYYMCKEHSVKPEESLFIDDVIANIEVAKK